MKPNVTHVFCQKI